MRSLSDVVILLACAISALPWTHALAVPAEEKPALSLDELRKTHSLHQVAIGRALYPAEKIYHDHLRWRGQPPTNIVEEAAAAATKTGTVQATPLPNDAGYLAPVTIGSQTFLVDIDTGSSDFWVFSNQLPKAYWGTHSLYKETGKQYTNPPETWDITYADGSGASGNVWLDNVTLGNIRIPAVVQAATKVPQSFVSGKKDGIMGFGFVSANTCRPYGCDPFFLLASPSLPQPLFTATLRKGKPGTYDFGFIDPGKYTGSIGYVTADNSTGLWGLGVGGYSIGTGAEKTLSFTAFADTGTVLLYLPDAILNAYYPNVPGAFKNPSNQYVYYPCASKLPNLSLYIGGHKAKVPGSYLNAQQVNATTCLAGLQSAGHVGANIIGDQFLKSQFVVFNTKGPVIGFAQQRGLPTG